MMAEPLARAEMDETAAEAEAPRLAEPDTTADPTAAGAALDRAATREDGAHAPSRRWRNVYLAAERFALRAPAVDRRIAKRVDRLTRDLAARVAELAATDDRDADAALAQVRDELERLRERVRNAAAKMPADAAATTAMAERRELEAALATAWRTIIRHVPQYEKLMYRVQHIYIPAAADTVAFTDGRNIVYGGGFLSGWDDEWAEKQIVDMIKDARQATRSAKSPARRHEPATASGRRATIEQQAFVVIHELLHVALDHPRRAHQARRRPRGYDHGIGNICMDAVINTIITEWEPTIAEFLPGGISWAIVQHAARELAERANTEVPTVFEDDRPRASWLALHDTLRALRDDAVKRKGHTKAPRRKTLQERGEARRQADKRDRDARRNRDRADHPDRYVAGDGTDNEDNDANEASAEAAAPGTPGENPQNNGPAPNGDGAEPATAGTGTPEGHEPEADPDNPFDGTGIEPRDLPGRAPDSSLRDGMSDEEAGRTLADRLMEDPKHGRPLDGGDVIMPTPEDLAALNEPGVREAIEKGLREGMRLPGSQPGNTLAEDLDRIDSSTNWWDLLRPLLSRWLFPQPRPAPHKPSKTYVGAVAAGMRPFYEPGITRHDPGARLGICIDTSGSVSEDDLRAFLGHIDAMVRVFRSPISVFAGDTEVTDEWHDIEGDMAAVDGIQFRGRGGTAFTPLLDAAEECGCAATVYLTDGYGDYGDPRDGMEVVWGLLPDTSDPNSVPWGHSLVVQSAR